MVKIMISFNHIVDIIYIIIGVITIISFARKGFVKAFFEHGRPFLAGVTAYKLGPILGKYFFDKYIFGGVTGWVSSKIETVIHIMTDKIDPEAIIDATPFIVRQFINTGKVQNDLQSMVENADASAYELSSVIATPFSKLLSNFLAYMIVFLVALVVFTLVGKLFDLIAKLTPACDITITEEVIAESHGRWINNGSIAKCQGTVSADMCDDILRRCFGA
jgi:hypothetical protein